MRILSVKAGRTVPVLLFAVAEGEEERRYALTEAEYEALGHPRAGDVLTPEAEAELCRLDERHRAVSAASRILEFGDNNAAQLTRKLRARGFGAEAAAYAVARMVGRGYIREADQLERAVLAAARKLWGPRRITEALVARGFDRKKILVCLDRLTASGEIDFSASRRRLLEERLGGEPSLQKRRAFLYRYGYGGGED